MRDKTMTIQACVNSALKSKTAQMLYERAVQSFGIPALVVSKLSFAAAQSTLEYAPYANYSDKEMKSEIHCHFAATLAELLVAYYLCVEDGVDPAITLH